jgi:hypothetical protein
MGSTPGSRSCAMRKSISCLAVASVLFGSTRIPRLHADNAIDNSIEFCISDGAANVSTCQPRDDSPIRYCFGVCREPGHPAKPRHTKPGDVNRSDCPTCRYRISDCRRAGQPHRIAPWAQRSITPQNTSWYVGGGAAFGGRCRRADEGTWGLDYHGKWHPSAVFMAWTCGRKQGGAGAYQTDGEPEALSVLKRKLETSCRTHPAHQPERTSVRFVPRLQEPCASAPRLMNNPG